MKNRKMKEKIINYLIEIGFSFDTEVDVYYFDYSDNEDIYASVEADFPKDKPEFVIFTYTDEKETRGCDIAFSDIEKYDIAEISVVIDKLINYYDDIKSKIKEDILKLKFIEVTEFQGEKMNGNFWQYEKYSMLFKESFCRLSLEKGEGSTYCDIDYRFYKEHTNNEEYKNEDISPELAGFGMIVFYMLKLDENKINK